MAQILKVQMFGELSVSYGETTVDDTSNRMRKVWLLLAYLIYSRQKRNTQDQYIAVVQGADTSEVDDPTGRLKALFYRCRSMLNQLYDTAGHDLILRKGGSYGWNTEIPLQLDVEEFDSLRIAAAAAQDADEKLSLCRQALALYRGDFLPKLSMEPWVMPISTYYHQAFLDVTGQTLELLESRQGWEESATLCSKALHIEPYSEDLYQHLMRCRIAMGDREGAVKAYEEMSELLFDTFGVMPSEESRQLYRDASRQINDQSLPIGTVREQLRESDEARGAVLCEYDFFRFLYQVQARAIVRSGDVIHIALLSVHGKDGQQLPKRSADIALDNLQELMLQKLRQGDVISRCSPSQLIVMLPQANYENSCLVCQRITKAFYRQFPHTPADIHFSVQPLEPMVPNHGK